MKIYMKYQPEPCWVILTWTPPSQQTPRANKISKFFYAQLCFTFNPKVIMGVVPSVEAKKKERDCHNNKFIIQQTLNFFDL